MVRGAVLAAAMKYCGLEGVLACGAQLQELLSSEAAADRELAARILGHIGVRHFYRKLIPLLSDPARRVRAAAVKAAGAIGNPRLVPHLIRFLCEDPQGALAQKALVRFGDEAVGALGQVLADPAASQPSAKSAARSLRRIGTRRALDTLIAHMDHADVRVRRTVLRGAARVHADLGRPQVLPRATMDARLSEELKQAYWVLVERQTVLATYRGQILEDTFAQDMHRSVDRIFSLLRLSLDPDVVRRVRYSLRYGSPAERSNALEVLDNSVGAPLNAPLIGLLEGSGPSETLQRGRAFAPPGSVTADQWLERHFRGGGGWHRAAALDTVGFHKIEAFVPHARRALDDPVPLVREVAAWSLARILGHEASGDVARLDDDPAPPNRRMARWLKDRYCTPADPATEPGGPLMLTRLEEALFMRHILIFEGVSAEDLAALADLTEETFAAPNEVIVREGDPGGSLYMIIRGQVEVIVDDRRVATLGPRDCFGEISLLDGGPRSATVRALEATDMLCLSDDEFHELLEERTDVGMNLLRILCQRLRMMNQKLVAAGATTTDATLQQSAL